MSSSTPQDTQENWSLMDVPDLRTKTVLIDISTLPAGQVIAPKSPNLSTASKPPSDPTSNTDNNSFNQDEEQLLTTYNSWDEEEVTCSTYAARKNLDEAMAFEDDEDSIFSNKERRIILQEVHDDMEEDEQHPPPPPAAAQPPAAAALPPGPSRPVRVSRQKLAKKRFIASSEFYLKDPELPAPSLATGAAWPILLGVIEKCPRKNTNNFFVFFFLLGF